MDTNALTLMLLAVASQTPESPCALRPADLQNVLPDRNAQPFPVSLWGTGVTRVHSKTDQLVTDFNQRPTYFSVPNPQT